MIKTVIFDVDDTLYSYWGCHRQAMEAVCAYARAEIGIPGETFAAEFTLALKSVRQELPDQAAWHERTVRFLRILEKHRKPLRFAPILDELYWGTFLKEAVPSPGIRDCMSDLKAHGFQIGIGTNMTTKWQIRKVEALGLLEFVDFFVSSEEAGADKPLPQLFSLCARKAGCNPEECVFVGDSVEHDVLGAKNAGMSAIWYTRGRENPNNYPAISHFDELVPLLTKKAIFLDLDGTLLDDRKEITPGNRSALTLALEQGHRVIIATGRAFASSLPQAEKLGLTRKGCYLLCFNGGLIYDLHSRKILERAALPVDLVNTIFSICNQADIQVQTYDMESVLVMPGWETMELFDYCNTNHIPYRVIRSCTEPPCKMLAMRYGDMQPLYDLRMRLETQYGGKIDCFFSCDNFMEIVPKGMNKGAAIASMCARLGIPMENTVAVGDAENDLSMIRAAHVGVAMANGNETVKAAADYITENDNNHDGVAEVVYKFLLN